MKKILVALCIACAAAPAIAQTSPAASKATASPTTKAREGRHANLSPEQRAKKHTDRLQKKLGLSSEQHSKLLAVNTTVITKKQALKAAGSERGSTAFKELRQYRREQYAAILTPAQMEQLKAMRAEQKQKHGGKGGDGQKSDPAQMPAQSN